jgi:hypothetical protein
MTLETLRNRPQMCKDLSTGDTQILNIIAKLMLETEDSLKFSKLQENKKIRSTQHKILLGAAKSMLQATQNSRLPAAEIQL